MRARCSVFVRGHCNVFVRAHCSVFVRADKCICEGRPQCICHRGGAQLLLPLLVSLFPTRVLAFTKLIGINFAFPYFHIKICDSTSSTRLFGKHSTDFISVVKGVVGHISIYKYITCKGSHRVEVQS